MAYSTIFWCFIAVTVVVAETDAKSVSKGQAFVVEELESTLMRQKRQTSTTGITSLKVTSIIRSRFARVSFLSKMENNEDSSKEMTFSVRLPKAAFITEFNMVVAGVTFVGVVREKEQAKKQYDQAVNKGNAGGLIAANVRETETFDVAANVPAHSTVDFHLTYQQLLTRKFGEYNHAISVNIGQVIDDFTIDVYITETTGITHVETTPPGSDASFRGKSYTGDSPVEVTTDVRRSKYRAKVTFKPTAFEQKQYLLLPEDQQKFTVKYEVTRENLGGEIQTRNGYFVHFFAPENLPAVSKNVVFVIDRSGSMYGRKIEQTKTALESILRELRNTDRFTIVTFASDVTPWSYLRSELVDASTANVDSAIRFTGRIRATGGTNLNYAILKATELLNNEKSRENEETASMIILLTDGNPTSGVTHTAQIRANARKAIGGRFSLFCLGFGDDVDHDFLTRLATENNGIARKIYEDSDADLQLEGFYQEVATPLLLNVNMKYYGAKTKDVSKSDFDQYFSGSEAVIVGATEKKGKAVKATIKGTSKTGDVVYDITSTKVDDGFQEWYDDTGKFDDFIERLWAYFTIRGYLEKIRLSQSRKEVSELSSKALALALKYKFVTSLTSMVVTTPEDEIQTTTVGPTIYPTVRPCLPWSSGIGRIIHPNWWCPLILNGARDSKRSKPATTSGSTRQRIIGRPIPRSLSRSGSATRLSSASSSSSSGNRLRVASKQRKPAKQKTRANFPATTPNLPPRTFTTTTTTPMTTTVPTTSFPDNLPKCGKILTEAEGRIELPTVFRSYKFSCTWQIKLCEDCWIDLNVEKINTTTNEVVIASGKQILMQHGGGVATPKTIRISSNKARVQMIIKPDDDTWPGVILTYKKVTREDRRPAAVSTAFGLSQSMSNCGSNISSDTLSGIISSPIYPKLYPDDARCFWKISNKNTAEKMLRITFVDIDIEIGEDEQCTHDVLALQYGEKNQAFCGYDLPSVVETDEEEATIKFLTDDSLGAGGFKLLYEFIEK